MFFDVLKNKIFFPGEEFPQRQQEENKKKNKKNKTKSKHKSFPKKKGKIMSGRLPPLPSVRELVKVYGLSAKKQLSQNFIFDFNLTDKIVRSMGDLREKVILEVGPGPGALTRSLLKVPGCHVVVVEKDKRFESSLLYLQDLVGKHRMSVVVGDILEVDEEELFANAFEASGFDPYKIRPEEVTKWENPSSLRTGVEGCNVEMVGNLPFSVSTPLLLKWIRQIPKKEGAFAYGRCGMTLMFQKEVADRIVASPSNKDFGRLAIMTQQACSARVCFEMPGRVFVPPPKVSASVVEIVPNAEKEGRGGWMGGGLLVGDTENQGDGGEGEKEGYDVVELEELLREVFQQRRKTLGRVLKGCCPELLEKGGEGGRGLLKGWLERRPEDLTVDEWCMVAGMYGEVKREGGGVRVGRERRKGGGG